MALINFRVHHIDITDSKAVPFEPTVYVYLQDYAEDEETQSPLLCREPGEANMKIGIDAAIQQLQKIKKEAGAEIRKWKKRQREFMKARKG